MKWYESLVGLRHHLRGCWMLDERPRGRPNDVIAFGSDARFGFLETIFLPAKRASSDDRNPAAWRNGLLIIKYVYIYMLIYIYISYRFTQRNILNHFSTWSYTPSVRNPVFVSKISNSVASGLYPRFLPTALLAPTSDCLFFQKQGVCAIRWLLGSAIPHPRVTSQRFSLNARLFWYLFSRPETRGKSHEVISSHILL